MDNFSQADLDTIKAVINNEINLKLNLLLNGGVIPVKEPFQFRNIARIIVEKSIESWGFSPDEINVIGPNDDNRFTIDFSIDISKGNSLVE